MTLQTDLENRIQELAYNIRGKLEPDEVTPSQRALATWGLGVPDRLLGGFAITIPEALGIGDVSAREYFTSANSFLYVNALAALEWSNELLVLRTDPYVEVEALGGRLNYRENWQPWLEYPLLSRPGELAQCRVPNPLKDGRMPMVVQIAALHKQHLGDLLPACMSCHSPFSLAVMMRGYHGLCADANRDPLFVHDLLRFCYETCVTYASAILEAGELCLSLIAPWEALLRRDDPEVFYEFALPYLSRFIAVLNRPEMPFGPVLWSRGSTQVSDWRHYLAELRGVGASALAAGEEEIFGFQSYRKTDLTELKDTLSSLGMVLVLQLSPSTVRGGSSEHLRVHVRDLFAPTAESGGLVVTTTIPTGVASAKIQGFSDAIRACRYIRHSEGA